MKTKINILLIYLFLSCLQACKGPDSVGSAADTPNQIVQGVVAIGSPLPYANVIVTDARGIELNGETDIDGQYKIIAPAGTQMVAPFKVVVSSLLGETIVNLYSFALEKGATANVTPLSTALMALLNAGSDYNAATLNLNSVTQSKVSEANSKLAAALAPTLNAANIPVSSFDPVATPFVANHQGIDAILDRVAVDFFEDGIRLNNKYAVISEENPTPVTLILRNEGHSGTFPDGDFPISFEYIQNLKLRLKNCFSVPASQRIQYTENPGISSSINAANGKIFRPNTLHANCNALASTDYKSQGKVFAQSWLHLLSRAEFDESTVFVVDHQFVEEKRDASPSTLGLQKFYNINIHVALKGSYSYTMFETMVISGNALKFFGNQRKFDIQVNSQFSKFKNYLGSNDIIETRLRIGLDPTFVPNSNGLGTYHATVNGLKPLPKILCAWITGPMLQKDARHDPRHPMGGILMAPPHSDLVARRDYGAIKYKYPMNFDPIRDSTHRQLLWDDCKSINSYGSLAEVSSKETNNQFTLDGAKANATSTATIQRINPTSYNRNGLCDQPANSMPGHCSSARRESFLDPALQSALGTDPRNLVYTAYLFVDLGYSEASPGQAYASFGSADSFFASAEKTNMRLLGAMPFLKKQTNSWGVEYALENVKYPDADIGSIDPYLKLGAKTLIQAPGRQINICWNKDDKFSDAAGVVITGYFKKQDGSRIGEAAYSDSKRWWPVENNKNNCPYKGIQMEISEDWYGYNPQEYRSGFFAQAPYNATAAYRDITLQTFDSKGGRIQSSFGGSQSQ